MLYFLCLTFTIAYLQSGYYKMLIVRCKYFKEIASLTILCFLIIKLFVNNADYFGNKHKLDELGSINSRQLQQNNQAPGLFQNQIYQHGDENPNGGRSEIEKENIGEKFISSSFVIDIFFIFINSETHQVLQYYFRRAVESLLINSSNPLRIHLITNRDGFRIGAKIISEVKKAHQLDIRYSMIVYVPVEGLDESVEPIVRMLQTFFTNKKHTHYLDLFFFFSLFLDRLIPGLQNVILLDVDIKVKGDITELYSHFSRFTNKQVMGLAPELSPVYRHILSLYRNSHPDTKLGSSLKSGGFQGYNSGVVLIDVPKLKNSEIVDSYLEYYKLKNLTSAYGFHGHLGDQDLYTLIAFDHPELFYNVPCEWNRQLCTWWRYKGYQNVFDEYYECNRETKIVHGNCKTPITDMDR